MTIDKLKERVRSIVGTGSTFGLELYACVQEPAGIVIKQIQVTDKLRKELSECIYNAVNELILSENAELDSAENISEERKILYEIPQKQSYRPFLFLDNKIDTVSYYSEADEGTLIGYAFKVNRNDSYIWFYQHAYPITVLKRSKSVYAILSSGTTYTTLAKYFFRIDQRIDITVIDNSIITVRIDLMQKSFGFDQYIKKKAQKTIDKIKSMDLLKDIAKLEAFLQKEKLTEAKKLMKAKDSPIFSMKPSELIPKLKKHSWYKDKFDYKDNKIVIKSQKAASAFIKMLNDDIVKSELTNQKYDSHSKEKLTK